VTDWNKFAPAVAELLGWFGLAHIMHCPQCDNPTIARSEPAESEVMLITTARGVSVPVVCGQGHTWRLRISSWWLEDRYAEETRKKLRALKLQKDSRAQVRPKFGRDGKPLPDRAFRKESI
jgi:hypothetical protein